MKITFNGKEYKITPAHPQADLYPWLGDDELQELAADIEANSQREPIRKLPDGRIVDGRNRELACLIAGVDPEYLTVKLAEEEIPAFVRSANAHRRHLTREQKRELIANALRENPEKSNNAIAHEVKASDKTVSRVRAELESSSDIPKLGATKGRDGRTRAKAQPKRAKPFAELMSRVTSLTTDLTRAINSDDDFGLKLQIVMRVCGLIDYPNDDGSGKKPRVLPLAGVHALLDLAGRPGPTPPEREIRLIYDKANGSWVPPLTERRRAKKRQR